MATIRFQLRRGTAAEWGTANPVLAIGEPGVETDTGKLKVGDGTRPWATLPYSTVGPQGIQGIQGPLGPQGVLGPVGPANTLSVGTVETLPGTPLDDAIVAYEVLNGTATVAALNATYLPGDATGATNGQVATWDTAAGKFKPKPGAAVVALKRFTPPPLTETIDTPLATDVPTLTKIAPSYTQMADTGWVRIPYTSLATPGLRATSTTNNTSPGTYGKQTINTIGMTDMPHAVEWMQDGTSSALVIVRDGSGVGSEPRYRIFVDGKPVTTDVQVWTEATNVNYPYILKLVFGTAAARRIRIELSNCGVVGVDKPPTATVYAPAVRRPKLTMLGDSWVEGTLETGHPRLDAMAWVLGKILAADVYVNGFGGTGYVQGNTQTPPRHYASASRLPNIYATNPDYVMIFGTINDDAHAAATITAAATALYAEFAANLPNAKLIVVGKQSYNTASNTGTAGIANRDAVKTAALAAPNVLGFIDPMAETWVTGTGTTTAPTGDGAADRFHNGATPNHLSKAGNRYYAERLAAKVATLTA